jgi:hypothetical protein
MSMSDTKELWHFFYEEAIDMGMSPDDAKVWAYDKMDYQVETLEKIYE